MDPDRNPSGQSESLQFERADFSQSAPVMCVLCKAPAIGEYFQINGHPTCQNCREKIGGSAVDGSTIIRLLRALVAGIGAGVAGFLIYWGIRAATGFEFGLVAIL